MTTARTTSSSRFLYVIACGAGPAADVGRLVDLAQNREWNVQVIATPAALDFISAADLETRTGRPVRSHYRKHGEPRSPKADAIIVAPATYNTINKWATGASDTYALLPIRSATAAPATCLSVWAIMVEAEALQVSGDLNWFCGSFGWPV